MESDEFYEAHFDFSRMEASGRRCSATPNPPSLLSQFLPFLLPLLPPHSTPRERSDWSRGPGGVFASQPCSAWTGPFSCRFFL